MRTSCGLKKLTNLQGNVNIIVRSDGRVYQIKANAMDTLAVTPATRTSPGLATFVSKANLSDITNPALPVSLGGNLSLTMQLTDNGDPGSADQIAVTLSRATVNCCSAATGMESNPSSE